MKTLTSMNQLTVGMIVTMPLYGRETKCKIIAIHLMGTVDVERLSDEKCFRLTGLT